MANSAPIINKFFTLYDYFIQLDLKLSLVHGRQYSYYKEMLLFCVTVIMNDCIKEADKEAKFIEFRRKIVKFVLENSKKYDISCQYSSTIALNKKLNNFLQNDNKVYLHEFLKSIQFFLQFRQKIQKDGRKVIAKENISRRMFYYFDFKEKDVMDKIIDNIDFNHIGNIPKQALIEFNNFMSHVCTAYSLSDKDENTDIFLKNIERAINHIKRGTLDCYKIIIKDYFMLDYSVLPMNIKNRLFNLRISEYKNLGHNNIDILVEFKKIVQEITKI
ncbi:hypothetical protein CD56_03175 [Campylobacter lari]|uniref:hypothetical protein n=1 Tax=Campylobacter lari TaxID=201 RepID=UPI00064019AC|nr:hypothetical protein [Campylobacter lari]AKJ53384.1 hypothetical protein CD56_03175 [Campylobacter lari]